MADPQDTTDRAAWFGCSHKVVWLALVTWEIKDWIRLRKATG